MSMSTNIHLTDGNGVQMDARPLYESGTQRLICYTLDLKCEGSEVYAFMTLEQMVELGETINKLVYPLKMPTVEPKLGVCGQDNCAKGKGDTCCYDCASIEDCVYKCDSNKEECGDYIAETSR